MLPLDQALYYVVEGQLFMPPLLRNTLYHSSHRAHEAAPTTTYHSLTVIVFRPHMIPTHPQQK